MLVSWVDVPGTVLSWRSAPRLPVAGGKELGAPAL